MKLEKPNMTHLYIFVFGWWAHSIFAQYIPVILVDKFIVRWTIIVLVAIFLAWTAAWWVLVERKGRGR